MLFIELTNVAALNWASVREWATVDVEADGDDGRMIGRDGEAVGGGVGRRGSSSGSNSSSGWKLMRRRGRRDGGGSGGIGLSITWRSIGPSDMGRSMADVSGSNSCGTRSGRGGEARGVEGEEYEAVGGAREAGVGTS